MKNKIKKVNTAEKRTKTTTSQTSAATVKPGSYIGVLIVAILFVTIVSFIVSLSGGLQGLINRYRPLPDFSVGEAYQKRQEFNARVNAINSSLESSTLAAYDFPYIDKCMRSSSGWKSKQNFLALCERRVSRLYFSNDPICEFYEKLTFTSVDLEFSRDEDCGDGTDRLFLMPNESGSEHFEIDIQTRLKYIERDTSYSKGLYSGSTCQDVSYCQYFEGNYPDWFDLAKREDYSTVVIFKASAVYYKK